VRQLEKHRRKGVLALAVTAGVLGAASPAAADVTVSPPSAAQGSGENVTFRVTNTARSAITQVKLLLPADMPIAEVYPLSVDNWAPKIDNKALATPLAAIHGDAPVTETAASITWIAMPGKALAPGAAADLAVALGPLPTSGTQMSFTIQPTYADPAQGAAMPPALLTLTPAVPGQQAAGHSAHSGTGTTTGDVGDAEGAAIQTLLDAQNDGPGFWTIAGWVVAALIAAAGAVAFLRSRRKGEPRAEPVAEEPEKELATAGAATETKASGWRYQG
jgi:hypothetical protein